MIMKKIAFALLLGALGTSTQNAQAETGFQVKDINGKGLQHDALSTSAQSAQAALSFQVEDIEVKGLQRVALGAALTHIPFNVGDNLNEFRISQSIKSLYQSGHFNDIRVYRDGNRLVYRVKERETISDIIFDGNSDLKDEQLTESLDGSNIRVGETLDRTVISGIEMGLENFYHSVGKYNAKVTAKITHLPRNRVILEFTFVEGDSASIKQINIVGHGGTLWRKIGTRNKRCKEIWKQLIAIILTAAIYVLK